MKKALIIIGSVLLALIIIFASVFLILVQRAQTPVDGIVYLKGVTSEVRIYRDNWGVPHIYAQNEDDLFFGQGYVHAQDRLWQMELYRRMASGTLSEIFGDSTIETDKFSRAVGLRGYAVETCAAMEGPVLRVINSYCEGINAFIKANSDNLPIEFVIAGFKPAEWVPADSMSVSELIAWSLGKNWELEILRGRLVQKLGAEKAAQLMAPYPDNAPLVVPQELLARPLGSPVTAGLLGASDCLGSNNWVVDGVKSETGKPLLANDPHLNVMLPSIWYETGLHADGFDAVGATLPGCPLVITGRNRHISWGMTNLPADVQDLFIEKINFGNRLQYEYKGQWKDMQVINSPIKVRGHEQPEEFIIRATIHGPLMDNVIKGLEQPLALQWSGNCRSRMLQSAYMLNKASNWEQFHEALRVWDVPGQNFVYADSAGNIGYQATGMIPIRAGGMGLVPSPGWTGEYDWTGYIPYEDLPSVLNPSTHYLATANNKVVSDNYSYFLGYDWTPRYRAERITEMLKAKERLSIQDFRDIQADVFDIPAKDMLPYMTNISVKQACEQGALELLKKWDLYDRPGSPGPAIYHTYYVKMLENTLEDDLGPSLLKDYLKAMGGSGDVHTVFMLGILPDNNNAWFDDVRTAEKETRDILLAKSFKEAVDELSARSGANPYMWQWGMIHTTEFRHVLSRIPGLGMVFNLGPIPTPGSRYTVNVSGFDYNKPYEVVIIPSYRHIIDWSNPDKSVSMHAPGQSGLVGSRHYGDMVESWVKVTYHTMLFNRDDVEENRQSLLVLAPSAK